MVTKKLRLQREVVHISPEVDQLPPGAPLPSTQVRPTRQRSSRKEPPPSCSFSLITRQVHLRLSRHCGDVGHRRHALLRRRVLRRSPGLPRLRGHGRQLGKLILPRFALIVYSFSLKFEDLPNIMLADAELSVSVEVGDHHQQVAKSARDRARMGIRPPTVACSQLSGFASRAMPCGGP